jgi:hypothetical protein
METYEVRLIIWESRDVPLGNSSTLALYVKATFYVDDVSDGVIEK